MTINLKSADVPLIKPVSVIVAAGTTEIISFPQRFQGQCVSLRISNFDGTNSCSYRIDGESAPLLSLLPSGNRSINDTEIDLLEIQAGAAGQVQVEAQVLPLRDSNVYQNK